MDFILCTNTREDAVCHADLRRLRRHEAPDLGHQHDQRDLTKVSGFSRHIGTGDDPHALTLLQHGVIWDKARRELLNYRVPAVSNLQRLPFHDFWSHPTLRGSLICQADECIELTDRPSGSQ